MKGFFLGAAAGYVLGARAGRARYDQIVRVYHAIIDHPQVRRAAEFVRTQASQRLHRRRDGRSVDHW